MVGARSERFDGGRLDRQARPVAVEEGGEPGDVLRHGVDGVEGGIREHALAEVRAEVETVTPDPADVAGFAAYLDRYKAGLAAEAAAVEAL